MGWLFFLLWAGSIGTAEAPPGRGIPPAVWDARHPQDSQPVWFGPVSAQAGWKTYSWKALLRPPPGDSRLALTLVFRETSGGFARVIWQEPGKSITLCGNLYEHAADLHQRTLLLDRGTIGGPGEFIVESTGADPVLERVELNWVEPLILAAGWAASSGYYLSPSGKIFPAEELQDGGRHAPSDEEKGWVMDAVLDAGPVKIEPQGSIRFLAPIAGQPFYGRFEAEVAGMAPGVEPWLWVNGRALAGVAVESPGLDDPGYRAESDGRAIQYGGWRKIWAFVPAGVLKGGENQVDVQLANGSSQVTLRNLRLQVVFGEGKSAVPVPAQAPAPSTKNFTAKSFSLPRLRTGLSSGAPVVGLRQE
jgi:hypothetical protein